MTHAFGFLDHPKPTTGASVVFVLICECNLGACQKNYNSVRSGSGACIVLEGKSYPGRTDTSPVILFSPRDYSLLCVVFKYFKDNGIRHRAQPARI